MEEFLRVQYIPNAEIKDTTLEGVPWGFGSTELDTGALRFNWAPPEQNLAEVDGRGFDNLGKFADHLAHTLWDAQPKPYSAKNSNIALLWEASEGEDFTRSQLFFRGLVVDREIHKDFPAKLVKELEQIPLLRTNMKVVHDALRNYLFKISALQQYQIERWKMLDLLIRAIGRAMGWRIEKAIFDPIPDAACAIIYTAGRMAKDNARVTSLNFGQRPFTWASLHGLKTVEIGVGR